MEPQSWSAGLQTSPTSLTMKLRSGRRLGSLPPPRSKRRCQPRPKAIHGDGIDHISGLSHDLLLQVLARLRCARAAARTSLLSRRWRGLWRDLPELTFREVAPDELRDALAQVTRTGLSLLDIDIHKHHMFSSAGVTALLRTAARLVPTELRLIVWGDWKDHSVPVEVPFFHRTKSVKIGVWKLHLTLPEQGNVFPVLERLTIVGSPLNSAALISQCPQLRVLDVCDSGCLGAIKVRSSTIEDLNVFDVSITGIDIVAPTLKRLTLYATASRDFTVSLSTSIMEHLLWNCMFNPYHIIIGMWGMCKMSLQLNKSVYILLLHIDALDAVYIEGANLMQMIAQFPDFSVMQLCLTKKGHAYGAIVFNLLGLCTAIKRLKIIIEQFSFRSRKPCSPPCPCDQPGDWRSQIISLAALEEVEIDGFEGDAYEVDLVKHLLRCAPMLQVITIRLSEKASPYGTACKKIYSMFKARPSLKWSFHHP